MLTGKQPETDNTGKFTKIALSSLDNAFDKDMAALIKDLLNLNTTKASNSKTGFRDHAFFSGLDWHAVERRTEMSPLFLAHDLEANDVHFTADSLSHEHADREIEEVVRYLQGVGDYKVKSL